MMVELVGYRLVDERLPCPLVRPAKPIERSLIDPHDRPDRIVLGDQRRLTPIAQVGDLDANITHTFGPIPRIDACSPRPALGRIREPASLDHQASRQPKIAAAGKRRSRGERASPRRGIGRMGSFSRFPRLAAVVTPLLRLVLAAWWLTAAAIAMPGAPAQAQGTSAPAQPSPLPEASGLPPAWSAFERTWAGISGYTATVTVFERLGNAVQNVEFDYTFHKPSSATVHVLKGPNAGVTLVWNGAGTVVAHRGSGLAALFTKTLSLHDPLVTTIRGSSIDQLSYAAILAHAHDTAGPLSQAVGPIIGGIPTAAVTLVPTTSGTDSGLTREVVDLSTMTNLPMRVIGYDRTTLVRQIDFSGVKVNADSTRPLALARLTRNAR
jgi:hypothetical protein